MKWVLGIALFSIACGGQTGSDPNSSGGNSSGGNSSGGTSTGGSFSGGSSSGGTTSCGPTDPGEPCGTLGETDCLAAHPRCVPNYDDKCCPECNPEAGCADCIDMQFLVCLELAQSTCVPGLTGPCGTTPSWACSGGSATCPPSGSACSFETGCLEAVPANCAPDELCTPECHPVTKYSCELSCLPEKPPPCSKGVPENGPNGYTGFCIREQVCQ